jgi:ThiF family
VCWPTAGTRFHTRSVRCRHARRQEGRDAALRGRYLGPSPARLEQHILARTKVGIIGLGGAGSLIAEYLGRLGVGEFILADPERAEISNLPRLTAATRLDAMAWLTGDNMPLWVRRIATRFARPKVTLARRNILSANPNASVEAIFGNFLEVEIARKFADCDYLFLAADTTRARLLFNALVHQFLLPGVQVGAKVRVDPLTGEVLDVYSVVRPVTSETGCSLCNNLINAAKLQEESISEADRKQQQYINEPNIRAPSVITLNATAVSHAVNDFLFYVTGLRDPAAPSRVRAIPAALPPNVVRRAAKKSWMPRI